MSKPAAFQAEYIVIKRTPYLKTTGTPHEGALNIGRVVWLDGEVPSGALPSSVTAYVEPVGLVNLDPHSLHSL